MWRFILAAAALVLWGCNATPQDAAPAQADPDDPTPVTPATLGDHVGQTYIGFIAHGGAGYMPGALGLSFADAQRFHAAMDPRARPSAIVEGAGVKALVFRGCASAGCGAGEAVLAVDMATGASFVAVRDAAGAGPLIANAPLEALLAGASSTHRWDLGAAQ